MVETSTAPLHVLAAIISTNATKIFLVAQMLDMAEFRKLFLQLFFENFLFEINPLYDRTLRGRDQREKCALLY